ncbi:MAG: hypothetical protein AB8G99_17980 [Planctomycetaceae bacterium]
MRSQFMNRRWKTRHVTRAIFLLGCLGTTAYLLWMVFVPPAGMPISKETTRLIGPEIQLDPLEGYTDWESLIRESRGLPVKLEPHPWFKLRSTAPEFHKTRNYSSTLHDVLMQTPFTEADGPEYSALIRESHQWYEDVLATEPPADATTWLDIDLRPILGTFLFRAMHQVGAGEIEDACQTFEFLARVFQTKQTWAEDTAWIHMAVIFDGLRMKSLRSALLASNDPKLYEVAIMTTQQGELPRLFSEALDRSERYMGLVCYSAPDALTLRFRNQSWFSQERIRTNWFAHRIDWPRYARFHHAYYDGLVAAFAIEDDAERFAALKQHHADSKKQSGDTLPLKATWLDVVAGDTTRILQFKLASSPLSIRGLITKDHNERRLTRLTVYLARFKHKHDRFPNSLDELEPVVPDEHQDVLCESPTGKRWAYEKTDSGFVLRESAGQVRIEWPLVRAVSAEPNSSF